MSEQNSGKLQGETVDEYNQRMSSRFGTPSLIVPPDDGGGGPASPPCQQEAGQ